MRRIFLNFAAGALSFAIDKYRSQKHEHMDLENLVGDQVNDFFDMPDHFVVDWEEDQPLL